MNSNQHTRAVKVHPDSVQCSIENCTTRPVKGKQIYPIPTGPTRCLWLDIIKRHNPHFNNNTTNYVCSDHFSDDQKLPNGHLRGNSVPSIFPLSLSNPTSTPIRCQFCASCFTTRKELLAHDRKWHAEEYEKMKINLVTSAPAATITRESPCDKCLGLEKVYRDLQAKRENMMKTIENLKALRECPIKPIKLEVNFETHKLKRQPTPSA